MSSVLLIIEGDLDLAPLMNDLAKIGYKVKVTQVKNWEDDKESDEDYQNLKALVVKRKNPAIVNRLIGNAL